MCTPSANKKPAGPSYDRALQGYVQSQRTEASVFVKPPKNAGESNDAYRTRWKSLRDNFKTSAGYVARESDKMLKARRASERQAYIDNWQAANPGQDHSTVMVPAAATPSTSGSSSGGVGSTMGSGTAPSVTPTKVAVADRLATKLKQKTAQRASRNTIGRAMLRIGA